MYTVSVKTFDPNLSNMLKKFIEQYLDSLEKISTDSGIKRSASYAIKNVNIERLK